jgi:2,5-dioxopentanoate dehydrogenase
MAGILSASDAASAIARPKAGGVPARPVLRPQGLSIIAGREALLDPTAPDRNFTSIDPATGRPPTSTKAVTTFIAASLTEADDACWQAWSAFREMADAPPTQRADLLEAIASGIEGLGDELLGLASDETGLGPARLVSERERTVHTLRLFASMLRKGDWVHAVIDTAQPSRRPLPRPDLRRMLRPLGPVAVFGAGNFPLAYSTAGGDTASALAAGCPVIVKGHPGHPATGELIARVVVSALLTTGLPAGAFSFLHGGGDSEIALGEHIVRHRAIRAVGFTGSFAAGSAISRLAANRPDPIPVFAEMGSMNPVFVLPGAMDAHIPGGTSPETIGERLAASIMNANGQMCTCPGLLLVIRSAASEALAMAISKAMNAAPPQTMITQRTRLNFAKRCWTVAKVPGVEIRGGSPQAPHRSPDQAVEQNQPIRASAVLFKTPFATWRDTGELHQEIFGPGAIMVDCEGERDLFEAASLIQGSLTATIWAGPTDARLARALVDILEPRAGRLIFNGVPTGVEVTDAMVHGGPFPATNQPHTSAVGPLGIQRWCRPVCYQNAPDAYLPPALRSTNPLNIERIVNGERTAAKIAGHASTQPSPS